MRMECPHCGGHYEVDAEYVGKKFNVPIAEMILTS